MKQPFAARIHHTFGMPLYSDDGQGDMCDTFYHAVLGAAYRDQSGSDAVDSLMVGGIDQRARTVQLLKEIAVVKPAVKDVVLLVLSVPLVCAGGSNVLHDRAAQFDVD